VSKRKNTKLKQQNICTNKFALREKDTELQQNIDTNKFANKIIKMDHTYFFV
jgi:hypothetical protein